MAKFWPCFWLLSIVFLDLTRQQECPAGFDKFDGNQKCYSVVAEQRTWVLALEYCNTQSGNLAQINNSAVQAFLQKEIQNRNNVNEVEFSTANDYKYHYLMDYGIDVRGTTSIAFQVMACHDAHIALSKDKGVDSRDTYEIVIGGWADSQSVIRDCKQCAHMDTEKHQVHPVDCNKYMPFWISWTNNVIKVGTGNDVGKNIFMTWDDKNPHDVNYVAFGTGFGSSGKWKIQKSTFNPGLFWLGGSKLPNQNNWLWSPSQKAFSYANWAPNEPDNSNSNEQCAVMDLHRGYQWADDYCGENRNFICETSLLSGGENIIGK